ncbi:MAG: Acetyltransferase (GNAT) domain [Gammaproteobacteria bacterium]|nr:Acetyltransferase (GNAT) domain [Gammaproteobacteria bacterium]
MAEIRDATSDDAGQICTIYNHYINNTVISFEETPVTIEEMQ